VEGSAAGRWARARALARAGERAERAGCSAGRGEAQDGPLGLSAGQAGVEWGRAGAGQIGLARGWVPWGEGEREGRDSWAG